MVVIVSVVQVVLAKFSSGRGKLLVLLSGGSLDV